MKKLIFTVATMLLGGLLHAGNVPDATTTGSIGLTKPSTTTADARVTYGAKLNTDMDIIAATMTNILAQQTTMLTATAPVTSAFNAFTSTTQQQFLVNSTNYILNSTLLSLTTFYVSSGTVGGNLVVVGSMTARGIITSTSGFIGASSTFPIVNSERIGWRRVVYTPPATDGVASTFLQTNGAGALTWAAAGGGAGAIDGSTRIITMKFSGSVFVSTIDVEGLPGMSYSMGPTTGSIIDIWAEAIKGSTVGWTRLDIAFSTGGINGLPVSYRTLPVILSTASSLGKSSFSGIYSTAVPILAHEHFGIQVTSTAASGFASQGLKVHFGMWFLDSRY